MLFRSLLAIPFAAICDYVYREIFIPQMERKRSKDQVKRERRPQSAEDDKDKDELMDAAEMTEIIDK